MIWSAHSRKPKSMKQAQTFLGATVLLADVSYFTLTGVALLAVG